MAQLRIIEPQPVELAEPELLAKLFRAVGDPTRIRILELVIQRPRIQREIVDAVERSQAQVSNHLACLVWCGLLEAERTGREVRYTLGDPRVVALIDLGRAMLATSRAELASCRRVDT